MGNLYSLSKALERLGYRYAFVTEAAQLVHYDGVILPGVGAFGDAMRNIRAAGLVEPLRAYAAGGRPLLGICLGMQLLFSTSEEYGTHQGLDLLPGRVVRFAGSYKIPHMGWNHLQIRERNPLLAGVGDGEYVYFVHSYYVQPTHSADVLAVSDYHQEVPAIVGRGSVYGMQFHPEKSGATGMRLLDNFVRLCEGDLS